MKDKRPTMTVGLFIKGLIFGFITWIPFLIFAFMIPIIGWILIPVALVWPIGAPYALLRKQQKSWDKSRDAVIKDYEYNRAKKA